MMIPKEKIDASGSVYDRVRAPMSRPGFGKKGQKISLSTNHYKVELKNTAGYFFQYSVSMYYNDGQPIGGKAMGRRIMDKVYETYKLELGEKDFAYDGEKSLFTWDALPKNELELTVVLDKISSKRYDYNGNCNGRENLSQGDGKRQKCVTQSKTFRVMIKYAAKIPAGVVSGMFCGKYSKEVHEVVKVLNIAVRQHAAKQGGLIMRQSFFHDDPRNLTDIGGGVCGCQGLYSSFCPTQNGLTLNMDGSLTTILKSGPVLDFLVANQNVRDPSCINWSKAKHVLKNLRVKIYPSNKESRITGLSEHVCKQQRFLLRTERIRGGTQGVQVTVYDYFVMHKKLHLRYSGDFPCVNIGKRKPEYIPIELCSLLPLQRYSKALSPPQRLSLMVSSRQKPQEKLRMLTEAREINEYAAEPMLHSCGVTIAKTFTVVEGRVLVAPKLMVGRKKEIVPRDGSWNLNGKMLVEPVNIRNWAVVNFTSCLDTFDVCKYLAHFGEMKGISVERPLCIIKEDTRFRQAAPAIRVEKMFEQLDIQLKPLKARLNENKKWPDFVLCLLPNKYSEIYGPWKRKALVDLGIPNQCISSSKLDERYFNNLLLKINAKLGGLHSQLVGRNISICSKKPTIIFGMDVCHGSTEHNGVPSIAAVVSSRRWPSLSRYRASVRSQLPKAEIIDSLFKPVPGSTGKDEGIIRELLVDFYASSGQVKPSQVIIFRDGVSEGQFKDVLNIEFHQILEACKFLDSNWHPKFTIIVAQKRHHTKFFQSGRPYQNIPPGTVVDRKVCHPHHYDFYMCPHAAISGTTRPIHYHVLVDEIGFSTDDLQELVHSLSYVYQKCTRGISLVTPIRYAHLAASQASEIFQHGTSERFSNHNGDIEVSDLPKLHKDVCDSMFFC